MLEKYIAALLVPYLSKYVDNINEDKLKVNIWSGKATLNDLVLRPDALDALLNSVADEGDDCSCDASDHTAPSPKSKPKRPLLPIKTYRGICKTVSISIPIKRLRSEPVVLEVGEVLITLKGAHAGSSDASGAATVGSSSSSGGAKRNVKADKWAAAASAKEKELDAFEAERKRQREQAEQQQTATLPTSSSDAAEQTGSGGFFSRLGELVVNNIIVKVGTVHIRYEDESTETVLGAILGGVQLLTMNECTAQPMFTDPCGLQRMWKRLVFNDLQVYCDDPTRVRANAALGRTWFSQIDDWQQWYHRMRQRVRDGNVALSTVLGPVSGTVDAKVVFKLCVRQLLETPFADVAVKLQYLMVNLTRPQYTKILETAMLFTNQGEMSQLQRSRPRVPVLGHAREWWQYAIGAVRTVIREPKRTKLLAQVSQVCKQDYQVLYRDVVRHTEMTLENRKVYRFVTRLMTAEDMKAGRKSVYAQIANEIQLRRKDNEIRKAEEMAKQHLTSIEQQQRNPKRAWLSWLSDRRGASCTHATAAQSDTAKEIEADEKLFRSIELDYGISAADAEADHTAAADLSSAGSGSSLPPSYCWLRASFDLPLTSYRIDTEKEESITLKLFQLRGGVSSYNKPNSLLFFFRTQNITLANPTSSPAAFTSVSSKAAASSSSSCDTLVPYLIEGVQVDRQVFNSSPNEVRVAMRSLTDMDSGNHLSPDAPTIYDVIKVGRKERRLSSLTPVLPSGTRDSIDSGSSGSEEGKQSTQHDCATPLFSITGFLNPVEQPLPDTSVDVAIRVQLLPLRVVADPRTIEQLIRFFSLPAGMDVSGFAESTKQAASAVGSAATHEVRAAMAKTKGLYVTVDASAPVLILPKSLSADVQEPALCVSLGRVLFKARPLSEAEKKRRLQAAVAITSGTSGSRSKALARVAADDEPESLTSAAAAEEALYYYPHKASFSKFYLELTTLERAMRRPQQGFFLVPEVSIAADVLQRIDDCSTAREAVVLRLRVPSLRVASSVHQVYLITTMMDAWLSNLRSPATASSRIGLPGGNRSGGGPGDTGMAAVSRLNMELLRRRPAALEGGETHWSDAMASTGDRSSADATVRGSPESGYGSSTVSPAPLSPTKAGMLSSSPNRDAAAHTTPEGSTDLSVMRLELLVERLGLDVHDDDPNTHAVSPLPAFQVECGSAELILAVRSLYKKVVLCLTKPRIAAARDTDFPIFSGGRVRVDLLLPEGDAPTAVALSLDSTLNVCVGTPCVELLETVMDMVHLILSAMDSSSHGVGNGVNAKTAALSAAATADHQADRGLSYRVPTTRATASVADDGASASDDPAPLCSRSVASRMRDLAYQVQLVQQQCSMRNQHVADVFVRILGSITVTLLSRAPGSDKDVPFASASIREVELQMSKYTVTMDLSGHVGEVSASVLASVGLAEANRTLLAYRPPSADTNAGGGAAGPSKSPSTSPSPAKPAVVDSPSASPGTSGKAGKGAAHRSGCSRRRSTKGLDADASGQKAHIRFSFRKSRPVMPVFAEVDGKRSLVNAQELRYSSAIELDVGASTITVDLHTVMIFKTYFTAGLFSRISCLADRPVYNGRTLPPTREGPRLLMSIRAVVRDTLVVLPVDPRTSDSAATAAAATTHCFCASLGNLTLQNSLRATEGQEAMIVSLGEVGMWREELGASPLRSSSQPRASSGSRNAPPPVRKRSPLLPAETHLEMTVHTALDLQSEDPPHIDIHSEDVSLELRETDLVQLVTLLRQNLTRTDPADIAAYALEAAEVRQMVLGKSDEPVAARGDSTNVLCGGASPAGAAAVAVDSDGGAGGNHSGDLCMSMRLGRISMLLSNASGEAASNPIAASSSRFQLQSTGVSMSVALPSNCVGVRWKSLELDDVRDDNCAALVWCEAGSLHFADSLTTHDILMRDFGVRRTALRSADAEVESMMGSVACSDGKDSRGHSSSSSVGALPGFSTGAAARGLSRRRPVEVSSGDGNSPASTQLFTMSVLSADFTLRRFAVSDQWRALFDLVCNEAVFSAWTASQKGMTAVIRASPSAGDARGNSGGGDVAPKSGTAATGSRSGMRVIVTTPSVVIPFLNSRREMLIEAHIVALLADVVQLPTVKQVAVKVRELNVVDARSGEKILFKRSSCGSSSSTGVAAGNALAPAPATQSNWGDDWEEADLPSSPLIAGGGGAAANSASSAPGAWVSATAATDQAEVLQFTFKSDPVASINKIQLGIGELHALVSMPIIQGLTDYFASPVEPVAEIASLGVMREQRARMAAAAQQMAASSLLVLNVLWHQPRIILAGDAIQLRRRSGNLEMRLGVMRAAVRMNSSAAALSVVVKVQEYSIPSLLKRSALRFAYEANCGVEMIDLQMKRTTALFHPAEVERLVRLAQRNVLMPRDVNYYGAYEKAVAQQSVSPSTPAAAPMPASAQQGSATRTSRAPQAEGKKSANVALSPPTPSRTVKVHIDGLLVAVHDTAGVNTHTLTLAALDTAVLPNGNVALTVPSLSMLDQSTGHCMLQSETVASPAGSGAGSRTAQAAASGAAPAGSGSGSKLSTDAAANAKGDAAATPAEAALRVAFHPANRTSDVQLGAVLVTFIPQSIGTLVNTLLSVHIPGPDEPDTAASSADQPISAIATARRSDKGGKSATGSTVEASTAAAVTHTSTMPFTFKATLAECRARFCQGDREVAMLHLTRIACSSNSYPNGANRLTVTLGNLFMVDSTNVNTNYRTLIYPYEDTEAGDAPAPGANPAGNAGVEMRNLVEPVDALVTYEVQTSAPPTTRLTTKSGGANAAESTAPTYTRHMKCRVGSLFFVLVPDVVRTVVSLVREAQAHISDGNRDKAYTYVSDRAAESMRRRSESEQLMEIDVIVRRPQVFMVDKPTATMGVLLSPGSLTVRNQLVLPSDATAGTKADSTATAAPSATPPQLTGPEGKLAAMPREVFAVQVRTMGMLLQGASCLQKDCNIFVQFQRTLPGPMDSSTAAAVAVATSTGAATAKERKAAKGDAGDGRDEATVQLRSMLKVDVPMLSMMLTPEQTDFAMIVLGALLNGTEANRTPATTTGAPDDGRSSARNAVASSPSEEKTDGQNSGGGSAPGLHIPRPPSSLSRTTAGGAGSPTTVVPGARPGAQKSGTTARASSSAVGRPPSRAAQSVPHFYTPTQGSPITSFTLIAHVGSLQAEVADLFRLRVEEARVLSTDVTTTGKMTDVQVDSIYVQHIGAEVEAPQSADAEVSPSSQLGKGWRVGAPRTSRIQEMVDVLTVTKLHILSVQPQPVVDVDAGSSMVENTISVSAGVFNLAVSPTILFDTREVLYLPFCYKVLRVPIDPIPILSLMDETTTLLEDVVLDNKHVLLTASRTRCCYVLNLNNHKLVLTGAPSGQIVLCEGCELTITNGTVHIPGMYTIGSYVSFAPSTALFTTDSVTFEKEFLNLSNRAFYRPFLSRSMVSPGGSAARRGSPGSPQSPVSACASSAAARTEISSMDTLVKSAAPRVPHSTAIELHDRTVRVLTTFCCDTMEVQMLSEEVVDLSVALCMQCRVKFAQDNENEQPARRTVSVQLLNVRSGEEEEHILLPTDMVLNVSGVENVSVSIVLDSIEFCTRATLLRSLVELGKDFGAAFIEETTVTRVTPRIEYETQSLDPLVPVLEAGECQHCGQRDAYLAPATNRPGILCYKCCTGYDHVPAMNFWVEVPLIDGIVFGSKGDMAHVFMRNVLLSVDPSMDLRLTLRASLYGFSNTAAVWEPLIEHFDANISGSVNVHDYTVRTDRLDYVMSPQNIRLLSGMAADYGAATALQKQLRKRFRWQKQLRTQQTAPCQGMPMYVDAAFLEEEVRLQEQEEGEGVVQDPSMSAELTPFRPLGAAADLSGEFSGAAAGVVNMSIFDALSAANRRLIGAAAARQPKRVYARVYVTNNCNVVLSVGDRRVAPRGGTLRFTASETSVTIRREAKPDEPQYEGYVTSLSNPALYVQTKDMVLETRVVLSQEEGVRHLRRTVTMVVYPLHVSRTIICFENRLSCSLTSTSNNPPVRPGERFYVAPRVDLNTPIVVEPVNTPDRVEYEAGKPLAEPLSGSVSRAPAKMPTVQEVLCGAPLTVCCKAKTAAAKSMTVVVYVRQEEMRGGVPTFVITIESRFRLRNKLPYQLIVNVIPDAGGLLAKGKTTSRPVQPLTSTVLQVRQSADLGLNGYTLNQVTFMLEVRQRGRRTAAADASGISAPSSPKGQQEEAGEEEVFSTLMPVVVSPDKPFVILRSQYRRQLIIRALLVTNNCSIMFSTPYVLLNHSPIPLTLRECSRSGENRVYEAEPNYSVLNAEMNASIAACPMKIRKSEDFFVNLYHKEYRGTCVPLHAQQRGVVVMQQCSSKAGSKEKSPAAASSSSKKGTAPSAHIPGPTVIHLAYSSQLDLNGSVLVVITPRWVLVNRSHLHLYAAPSTYSGMTAREAAAVTEVMVAAQQKHSKAGDGDVLPPTVTPMAQEDKDAMKHALQEMVTEDKIVFLSDAPTQVMALPPHSATPMLETPLCGPEIGYNLHILQSPLAPLYGTPIGIESIHSELIIAYKPLAVTSGRAAGVDVRGASGIGDSRGPLPQRDRFLEVSITARGSYTYVVLELPEHAPYLLLNRTGYTINVRDTAVKSKGRLMGHATPGHGTELFLDHTVTTLIQLELLSSDGRRQLHEVSFDVGRPMIPQEMNAASASAAGVLYTLGFGGNGQQIIEITPAKAALPIAYVSVAAPPIPINLLLNMAVMTLSVVMPSVDVLFCAVTDVRFSWDRQKDREMTKLSIENFQVDNQTEVSPRYDSCLLSLRTSKSTAAASGYLERILVPAKGLICLEEVRLDVVPLALRVSDTLLVAIAGFVQAVRSGEDAPHSMQSNQNIVAGSVSTVALQEAAAAAYEHCPTPARLFRKAPVQIDVWASRLTLERFIVNPIVVRVWLTRDVDEHDFFRENINSKDAALLSMMLQSCEDVTVAAPGIVTAKQTSRLGIFAQWVGKTYTDRLLGQLKGLLLQYASSLPLIGAPLKLASGFGNGAVRLFREPVEGLSTSPSAFATGLARGSAGFAQEFAGGGLGAVSNITASWSRLLSMSSGVSERERRKQNVFTGFARGIKGVVQRPMEGAAESGAAGLLKGTAQGLVGVLANPMSGLLSDMSRATGTLAKLVTDTYIPKTRRLRAIRDFHANGGVAPWRSLASVYQYQRIHISTGTWSGAHLISSVDGPEWYPSQREGATYGKNKTPIPEDRWTLDRYNTNFMGWTYSTKYYGIYTDRLTDEVRVRRMRWTALIQPLPYSRVAFYLRVCPGMETQHRRTPSSAFARTITMPQESTIGFTSPGMLQATTVEQLQARKSRGLGPQSTSYVRSRSGSKISVNWPWERSSSKSQRANSEFFTEEEYMEKAQTIHDLLRSWTAVGRNVGVKGSILRTHSGMPDDDDEADEELPDAGQLSTGVSESPAIGVGEGASGNATGVGGRSMSASRGKRRQMSMHSRSNSEPDPVASLKLPKSSPQRTRDGDKRRSHSWCRREKRAESVVSASAEESPGSMVPVPTPYVRSASGKMLPVDTASSVAPVPGASSAPLPRTASNANAPPPSTVVEVYEYQKKVSLLGWGKRHLPSNCPAWQDVHGHEVPSRHEIRAPAGWVWTTEWTIIGGDRDGWTIVSQEERNLRRRTWQRRLQKQVASPPHE